MSIKLICIDMDGTLLNDEHEISDENKQAILAAIQKGVHVVLTTGRLHSCAKLFAKQLGLNTPLITSNGAYIVDETGKQLYKNALTQDDLHDFTTTMDEHNLYWFGATNAIIFATQPIRDTNVYLKLNQTLPPKDHIITHYFKTVTDLFEAYPEDILIVNCTVEDDLNKLANIRACLEQKQADIEIVSSWANNFEVLKKGSTKGHGVELITKYFKLTPQEVMCIGDSENDLSMLTFAKTAIAMENATDQLKQVATYITTSNNHHGVAKAIHQFVLTSS